MVSFFHRFLVQAHAVACCRLPKKTFVSQYILFLQDSDWKERASLERQKGENRVNFLLVESVQSALKANVSISLFLNKVCFALPYLFSK